MSDAALALPQGKRYMTVRQTALEYPALTESSLRWLRFNGSQNGFDACVIKLGRRILLDAEEFERWLQGYRENIPAGE